MAVTPQSNDAFVREVDEELRRDTAERFVRRWGLWLVVAVGLVLVATGGWLWWRHEREQRAAVKAEQLVKAFADAERGAAGAGPAKTALDGLVRTSDGGYRTMARLTQAALAAQSGDARAAAAGFAGVASDTGVAQPLRDLALLRQTATEFDTLPPGTVVARLQGLAVTGNPWFGSAGEMMAMAQLKQNKRADAGRTFAALARDPQVPETIRSRSVQMAGLLGVDATGPAVAQGSGGTSGR